MTKQKNIIQPQSANSIDDLTLTRERDRCTVNTFLESHHPRGGVVGWFGCFGARFDDIIVAVCVLSRPTARHFDDGSRCEISRFARRDDRPDNTGSWLIGQAREWARLEGFDEIITYAGVAGNEGVVYRASGFDCDEVTISDGKGWTNRNNRESWDDYERRRYRYELNNSAEEQTE